MNKLALFLFGVVGIGSVMTCGCRPTPSAEVPQPPKVTVASPIQRNVVDSAPFTGRTEAVESVEIRARVKGWLAEVAFPKKDADGREIWDVKAGDTLFMIEQDTYRARLSAAMAQLQQTQAKQRLADASLARAAQLVQTKTIAAEEYQARLAEKEAADAQALADQAAIEQAKIDFGYTTITSPISGRVSRNLVDAGNLVGADQNTLLCTVIQMDPMHVYFDVSEKDVLELLRRRREHQDNPSGADPTVHLGLANEEGYPHQGKIDYLDNRVDPATGTALVRAVFDNPEQNRYLYPGLFVRIQIPLTPQEAAVLVEEEAIGTDLGGKYVLVVGKGNIVDQRYVELGTQVEGLRVVRKGLLPQEKYIVKGVQRARPGLPVTPEMAKPTQSQATASASAAGGEGGGGPMEGIPAEGNPVDGRPVGSRPVEDDAGRPASPPDARPWPDAPVE